MTASQGTLAQDAPELRDTATFAADIVLVGSFVISIGIPLYHTHGLIGPPTLLVWYVISAAALPLGLPLLVWYLRWGRPTRGNAGLMLRASFTYSAPVLLCVAAIAYAGLDIALTGVAVMVYVAAILVVVAHGRLMGARTRNRMLVLRWTSLVLTPAIVLGFTGTLPHGLDAIQGWGIPVPVMAAGAYGCVRALRGALHRD